MVTKPLSDYQRHSASWIKKRGSKERDPVCSIPMQPACTAWPCSGTWESMISILTETLGGKVTDLPSAKPDCTLHCFFKHPIISTPEKPTQTQDLSPESQLTPDRALTSDEDAQPSPAQLCHGRLGKWRWEEKQSRGESKESEVCQMLVVKCRTQGHSREDWIKWSLRQKPRALSDC